MIPLTIGFATYDDFDGAYFTLQALRVFHHEHLRDCEILVVDNNPEGKAGPHLKTLVESWASRWPCPARYVPFAEAVGPANAKERVMQEATKPAVLCMDGHVLLPTGTVGRLRQWYTEHPDCQDLLTGPMFYDDLTHPDADHLPSEADHIVTQFDDQWRGEMWGIWGHDPRGQTPNGEPFEIWANGMGLFSCRKDAWLGFNPHFRGFGGEEGYIHTKYRQAGRKTLCLPFLRWLHRFGRPNGAPYPLTRYAKVRNYVLGHRELGLSLDPVHEHFVQSGLLSEADWNHLLADPEKHVAPPDAKAGCGGCSGKLSLDTLYERAATNQSDLHEHVPKLRELAGQCDVVVDMGMRAMISTVAMLAGQPKKLVSYTSDKTVTALDRVRGDTELEIHAGADSLTVNIPECDLLFIDTRHTGPQFLAELERHASKVRRWIVRHDTQIYGERGEDGGPGLMAGLRRFMRQNPEWSVVYHTNANYGLTVISRNPDDKPALPPLTKQAWNYAKALLGHKISGRPLVTQDELDARLDTCMTCEFRTQNRCSICGCYLDQGPDEREGKAMWRDQVCPIGKWPDVTAKQEAAK